MLNYYCNNRSADTEQSRSSNSPAQSHSGLQSFSQHLCDIFNIVIIVHASWPVTTPSRECPETESPEPEPKPEHEHPKIRSKNANRTTGALTVAHRPQSWAVAQSGSIFKYGLKLHGYPNLCAYTYTAIRTSAQIHI